VALEIDFVGPMVLTAIVSNSAGLLTLVGDPATFLVGSSIGMSFGQYLRTVSLGGLLSLLILIPLLPLLMPHLWRLKRTLPPREIDKPFQRPWFALLAIAVLAIMVGLFLFGEDLPTPVGPPAVAIIAASLALLVIYSVKFEPVDNVLRDIDWKTLVFLSSIFLLVEAKPKPLLIFAKLPNGWHEFTLTALALIVGIGAIASWRISWPLLDCDGERLSGRSRVVPEIARSSLY
jgi:Na+/H+ antiporter NhaD/arsenite permease-like protein